MTNKEAKAIFLLEYCSQNCGTQYRRHCDNCEINLALKALEKQIPKKPTITNIGTVTRCPACGAIALQITSSIKISYCASCGQAILWEGEEE